MEQNLAIIKDYIKNELGVFVQDRFNLELDGEDLTRENLATLTSISALIAKRKSAN